MAFKNFYFKESVLEEDLSLLNGIYKLFGSQTRSINPSNYINFVISSKAFAQLMNRCANDFLNLKNGHKPKEKIYVNAWYKGKYPSIESMKKLSYKDGSGKQIHFWLPLTSINSCTLYTTNSGLLSSSGELVLWDCNTTNFDVIDNTQTTTKGASTALEAKENKLDQSEIDTLLALGWKPNQNQFIFSLSPKAEKMFSDMVGMPLASWITVSKIGSVSDPYGTAGLKQIATEFSQSNNTNPQQPTQQPDQSQNLITLNLTENQYNKFLTMIPQTVDYSNEVDLQPTAEQNTKEGKKFTFKNNGVCYVYSTKDNLFKAKFDELGKEVLQKYPSWAIRTKQGAVK